MTGGSCLHASAREGGRASKRASKREWKRHASTQQAAFATAGVGRHPNLKFGEFLLFLVSYGMTVCQP